MMAFSYITIFAQEDSKTYKRIRITQIEFSQVSDVKWSPDGTRLAVVTHPSIHIFDTRTWDTVLDIADANVSEIAWSPDSTRIASVRGGYNESLLIWDAITGEMLERFDRYDGNVGNGYLRIYRLSWSPDGKRVASDSSSLSMLIWDTQDGNIVVVEGHKENGVTETDWSPNSDRIVSGGADGTVRIWNAETGEQILRIQGGGFVDWHPTDEKILGYGGFTYNSHFALVWNAISGEELLRVDHGEPILSVRWNQDGSLIATGGLKGVVNIWDGQTGTNISTIYEHAGEIITALSWHPKNLLASASLDGRVIVWEFR